MSIVKICKKTLDKYISETAILYHNVVQYCSTISFFASLMSGYSADIPPSAERPDTIKA
jgi:hypothetical protein